jgi:transcriptional regulator of arginine metabolism
MEISEKEKIKLRQAAIKELIKSEAIEDQQKLVDLIKERYGIEASQAVISRDLRALGVGKRKVQNKMVYEIAEIDPSKEILRLAIVNVQHNESLIIIHTLPGLAAFVGDYLDMRAHEIDIIGTIAGENTLFVAPQKIGTIKQVFSKICKIIYFKK